MSEFMCDLCFPEGKEFGKLIPGYYLIHNNGEYALLGSQGHADDEVLFFPDKPTPDPDPDCTNEVPDDDWFEKVWRWEESVLLKPEEGYHLCEAARKAGWEKGSVLVWLYDKAGKLIEKERINAGNT